MSSPLDGNGVALKPCPFCGGEATVHNYPNVTSGRDWFVHCPACDMSLDAFSTRAEAIAAWNRRAPPAPSHTAVEPVAELVTLLTDRGRQESDGEVHLTNEERISLASTLTAQAAALAKAESELEQVRATYENLEASEIVNGYKNRAEAAESEVATLKARVAELEAGLEPFANRAFKYDGSDDDWFCTPSVQVKDLRRARRLTHQEKNNGR